MIQFYGLFLNTDDAQYETTVLLDSEAGQDPFIVPPKVISPLIVTHACSVVYRSTSDARLHYVQELDPWL